MRDRKCDRVLVRIISPDCATMLTDIYHCGISVFAVTQADSFTLQMKVSEQCIQQLTKLALKYGGEVSVLTESQSKNQMKRILTRPVLMIGIFLILVLSVFLPTRALFFHVEGNELISKHRIMEMARECGVTFGTSVRKLRNEEVKNRLLEKLPELKWVGINSKGCQVVIYVQERRNMEKDGQVSGVTSIIAARDGIIDSCTVTRGNLLCKIGQAVKTGQMLVSGYTDCGLTVRATQSDGEIFAQTKHNLRMIVPSEFTQKGERTDSVRKFSLVFGKKRINLYNDSGILDTTCDKMYTSYALTLPGGFQLPVKLLIEELVYYPIEPVSTQQISVSDVAQKAAQSYLLQDMVSGTVVDAVTSGSYVQGAYILEGEYRCREMIGRLHKEEIWSNHGKNDRTPS